jgi:leucyl aminopeptidase
MNVFVDSSFDPIPSLKNQAKVSVEDTVAESGTLGQFVSADGELPNGVDLSREALAAVNFTGKKGQTQSVPGDRPRVFIGTGKGLTSTAAVRDAVAAFARAAKDSAQLVVDLRDVTTNDVKARELGSAAAEGALLARYRWDALKNKPETVALEHLTIVVNENEVAEVTEGANHGSTLARSAAIARDLGNTPPRHLNADHYAQVVERLAGQFGLTTEVYDRAKIEELGLGGVLGVNAGSVQEPRVIKVMYRPSGANTHIGFVGKGITYDSGGISLKPSNASHASMKMDMMGSGAVFAAMTALQDLGVQTAVTGWMMCTDNMPSGSATKLGDVLTMRNGKTVEVRNTDAEGRLVLGDGLALATEETPRPDALVDIATLTGAAMAALGTHSSAMFANNDAVATQLQAAADRTAEDVWRMPLDHRLRKDLKSNVADFSNIGGPFGGAIVAAIYLNEFVDGIPWGHLDIAGTMESESDDLWRSAGSTGVGARLLAEFASAFEKPSGEVDTGNDE